MAFNITEFKSRIDRHGGLITPAHAEIIITPPRVLAASQDQELFLRFEGGGPAALAALATNVLLPGIGIVPDATVFNGYGQVNYIGVRPSIAPVQAQFYVDEDGFAYRFFLAWVNGITNFNSRIRNGYRVERPLRSAFFNEVGYRADTTGTIQININGARNTRMIVTLYRAWPIEIGSVMCDWGDVNQVMRVPIEFMYETIDYSFVTGQGNAAPTPLFSDGTPLTAFRGIGGDISQAALFNAQVPTN